MKKISVLLMTIMMLLINVSSVCGETNGVFVPSIDVRSGVGIGEDNVIEDTVVDGCSREIILTPYVDRETIMSDVSKAELAYAYNELLEMKTLYEIPELKAFAMARGIPAEELVIRDVFDLTPYYYHAQNPNHDESADHYHVYNLVLNCEDLENFVALLHYVAEDPSQPENGEWIVEEDAALIAKDTVQFTAKCFCPFAVVVRTTSTNPGYITPVVDTGVSNNWMLAIIGALFLLLMYLIICFVAGTNNISKKIFKK